MKVGLVGYRCHGGLGEMNRQLATYGCVTDWLIGCHHRGFPTLPSEHNHIKDWANDSHGVAAFVRAVDLVIFVERLHTPGISLLAREMHKPIVCVPNHEWTPCTGWVKDVDLFVCPTKQCFDILSDEGLPCICFPWPIDTERFQFHRRSECRKYLFLDGHGGWQGRKGGSVVNSLLELWKECPVVLRSQRDGVTWMSGAQVLPALPTNDRIYDVGDVLIAPHSVDGLGLEVLEAMACGMPVITSDGLPWNEFPALGKIESPSVRKKMPYREVDWYLPRADSLVRICQDLLGKTLSTESTFVRRWAEERSWNVKRQEFANILRGVLR